MRVLIIIYKKFYKSRTRILIKSLKKFDGVFLLCYNYIKYTPIRYIVYSAVCFKYIIYSVIKFQYNIFNDKFLRRFRYIKIGRYNIFFKEF
jgi:hypothetical protein